MCHLDFLFQLIPSFIAKSFIVSVYSQCSLASKIMLWADFPMSREVLVVGCDVLLGNSMQSQVYMRENARVLLIIEQRLKSFSSLFQRCPLLMCLCWVNVLHGLSLMGQS